MKILSDSEFKLAFVGGGQMASAIIAGLIRAGREPSSIHVIEPLDIQRARLEEQYGVTTAPAPSRAISDAHLVVWAVKPHAFREACLQTTPMLGLSLHLSVAAGLTLSTLCTELGSQRVVRAMPNTSALVGAGVTGLAAAASVSPQERAQVESILASTGQCFWFETDERLDAVTAISGSGPAYVFHFLEAFQAAAESMDFPPELARELVLQTASGAIAQAMQGDSFAALRSRVTSKRGTTEAALAVLQSRQTSEALHAAVQAAYKRASQLSLELVNHRDDVQDSH